MEKWCPVFKQELKQVDEAMLGMAHGKAALIPELVNHIISSGGKRLRPILTILSAKLCGYSNGQRHINLAAAIEFLHTATLLHDDVVDDSELRRGTPTANDIWGNSASVLVGDFLLSCAFQLMANDGSIKIFKTLSNISAIVTEGEIKQLMAANHVETTKETYTDIISSKTAQLFAASCSIGAVIADKSEQEEGKLHDFGQNLGTAFQIADDALDYSAKQEELGKSIGDDFREGKVTLPVILAYERGSKEEKKFWQRVINGNQKEGDLATAIDIIKGHGILAGTMKEAEKYVKAAVSSLDVFPDSDEKSAMLSLLEFSVNRPY